MSEAGFSQCHSRVRGTHQHLIKQLAQNLASNGEVPSLDGLCPLSLQADGSRFEGNACSKQSCNNIVFCGSLRFCWFKSKVYAGDRLWKVRGPEKYHKIPPPRNSATAQHQPRRCDSCVQGALRKKQKIAKEGRFVSAARHAPTLHVFNVGPK